MRWVISPIALLVLAARHRLIVWQPSVRQILERLFDFVVLQFDTPLEHKKAGTFDFPKVPTLPIQYSVVYLTYLLMFHLQICQKWFISLTLLKTGVCHQWKKQKTSEAFKHGKP